MSKKISKQITYWLGVVAIGLVAGLGIQFVQAGWTEPNGAPGAVNIASPINISTNTQNKAGGLGIGGILDVVGNTYLRGNVGIGTTTPSQKLDVNGAIKVANTSDSCNSSRAGAIKYDGSSFQGCNGNSWINFGGETQGTWCGLDPAGGGSVLPCKGVNPESGCPADYEKVTIYVDEGTWATTFLGASYIATHYTCIKR